LSQFDEMDFEYSKEEVVELNRKENPKEADKWALEQLAVQKIKIEEQLRRMELEEQQKNQKPEIVSFNYNCVSANFLTIFFFCR